MDYNFLIIFENGIIFVNVVCSCFYWTTFRRILQLSKYFLPAESNSLKEYNKVYIGFHKFTSYQDTTTSETKNSHNFVNLPLVAVDELIKCLVDVRDFAKQQAGVYHLHTIVIDG